MISDPINMFDMAPYADGAAAVLITRSDLVKQTWDTSWCASADRAQPSIPWRCTTGPIHWLSRRPAFRSSAPAAKPAFCQRCRSVRTDRCLLDLCRAFARSGWFCRPGEGWKLGQDGCLDLQGSLPIQPWAVSKRAATPWLPPVSTRRSKRRCSCAARPAPTR
jgi:acetyl-CoA C-acetyltransferase